MSHDVLNRSERNGVSVLISGAGIAGLTAALECWRHGFEVTIVERNERDAEAGDWFTIGPSAHHVFEHWPDMEAHRKVSSYTTSTAFHNHRGERLVGPLSIDEFCPHLPENLRGIHRYSRPKLHYVLLRQLSAIGVPIKYGSEVVDYFEDGESGLAGVTLKDGSRLQADLVVAADGVKGRSDRLVAGYPVPARPTGKAVFRVAYPVELADADPVIAERFRLEEDGTSIVEMWMGNEDEMTWGITHPDDGMAQEAWQQRVTVEAALNFTRTIPGWPEVADRVIKATPAGRLVDWKIMWRDPQPTWTSPSGRIVQIGDAAHTFLPSSGNGGTQAMEDAISLAACLRLAGGRSGIPDATRVHTLLRFERVSCLQALGVTNREKQETDAESRKGGVKPNMFRIGRWVVAHDPERYANDNYHKALAHLTTGAEFTNTNTPAGLVYKPWTIDGLLEAQRRGEPTLLDVIASAE